MEPNTKHGIYSCIGRRKFRLMIRVLTSGKYQVTFEETGTDRDGLYGYVLVNAETTIREVVSQIRSGIFRYNHPDQHLYSLGKTFRESNNTYVYRSN